MINLSQLGGVIIVNMIYEALPKPHVLSQDNMTIEDWIDTGISLTIAFLLAALIIVHYPKHTHIQTAANYSASIQEVPDDTVKPMNVPIPVGNNVKPVIESKKAPGPVINEAEFKVKHVLNGVFASEEEKVAMVNNRFYNIGDRIDGMKIVDIEPEKIRLENADNIIELKIVV